MVGEEDLHEVPVEPVDCGICHAETAQVYEGSLHGYARQRGNDRAPSCVSCHAPEDDPHAILPPSNPRSTVHQVRVPDTCAQCHGEAGLLTDEYVKLPESWADYSQSVHGQGATHGIAAAASCADCHEVHDLKSAADPESPINFRTVSSTCGQCHPDIQVQYDASIHGRALQAGVTDSPTCTDCHGEHLILSPSDPQAKTYASRLATETCGACHDDPVIIAKYNMQEEVVGSYTDSYHGWAVRRDYENAATCVSCHTAHMVLPEEAPASTVSQENVVSTCQSCHPDADMNFARSYTHEAASITRNPINRTIRAIYYVLIALIIGGMVVHNLVVMNFYMVESRRKQEHTSWVMRFDKSQIVQHLLLTVSFVGLVITGFALRFPDALWVQWLLDLGMTESVRADLHRILAVVLVITSAYHMYYIFATRRGWDEFKAMLPRLEDLRDFTQNIRYHTWQSRREVKFGRYDYSQKAEYWALVWGTILMIITGFVLWFPAQAVKIFPHWIVTASQTIHYYEAWLATLAIIVWHFFFVIFHPEEYPMSWTWLTGRMSEESVKKHHTQWYEDEIAGASFGEEE